MKTINKFTAIRVIKDGGNMVYDDITTKVWVEDKDGNNCGTVRFETYLKMMPLLLKVNKTFSTVKYTLKDVCY